MANRHLSRSIVLQTLFERDFNNSTEDYGVILERNIKEFAPSVGDKSFMETLMEGILSKQEKIDSIIEKAAPDWPIDKIAVIDRNILRIGLYELLFVDRNEVPAKVAINEAIELAKTFGGDNSGKFINGVLGAVYKELGEPGKNDIAKKKFDITKLPIDRLVGVMVYAKEGDSIYLALIHDVFGHWTLVKGHLTEGEGEKAGVVRKALEEMGAKVVEVRSKLGHNEYLATDPKKGKIRKQVSYFLARADFEDLKTGESGGIDDAKWFKLADVVKLNFYDDVLPIITKGINKLLQKNEA